jgi:hypothetical protein
MQRIVADVPMTELPSWAVWQRRLFDDMGDAVQPFLDHFCRENGEFIWEDEWGGGSADDYYEPFFAWPLVYLMGGPDHLLSLADRQWDAVTRQLTRMGTIHKEYGIAADNMHQSEQDNCFYSLCAADPTNAKLLDRARRFAGFYLNEDPDAINYDPALKIVLSGNNGSKGAVYPTEEDREKASYNPMGGSMERYNLPFFDLPGITKVEDLADPANAKLMGQALHDRWKSGDTPINLSITSLMTNAFLLTGEEKYRDWVVEYTDAWLERARANDGLLPDQIGHSGKVGEHVDGKWYGGNCGWTFPHGFLTIQFATLDASANAHLLTRDDKYLSLARDQQERILELGEMREFGGYMSVSERWAEQFDAMEEGQKTLMVPYRYGDAGWLDYQPMSSVYPVTLWNVSMADRDWSSIERVREGDLHEWNTVFPFHNKEDSGHEQPWVRFLAGDNPTFPEQSLHAAHQILCRRLALVREDQDVGGRFHIHQWQWANPVSSEALVQLTMGGPQPIYNGGLLHTRLRYYDVKRKRPGLPEDVGALVEKLEADRTVVRLVNLSPNEERELVVQAGAFGEHSFGTATFEKRTSQWPGELGGYAGTYAAPPLKTEPQTVDVNGKHLTVVLPPATDIRLDLSTQRYVNEASHHAGPF